MIFKIDGNYYEVEHIERHQSWNGYTIRCSRVISYEEPKMQFNGNYYYDICEMGMKDKTPVTPELFNQIIKDRTKTTWINFCHPFQDRTRELSNIERTTRDAFTKTYGEGNWHQFTSVIEDTYNKRDKKVYATCTIDRDISVRRGYSAPTHEEHIKAHNEPRWRKPKFLGIDFTKYGESTGVSILTKAAKIQQLADLANIQKEYNECVQEPTNNPVNTLNDLMGKDLFKLLMEK